METRPLTSENADVKWLSAHEEWKDVEINSNVMKLMM